MNKIKPIWNFIFVFSLILLTTSANDLFSQTFLKQNWEKEYDGNVSDRILFSLRDNDNSVYLIGETETAGIPGSKILILKISVEGKELWKKTFGGNASFQALGVYKSQSEGFYVLGNKTDASSKKMVWISKIDSNGNQLWEGTTGGSENEMVYDLAETNDFGLFVCGSKVIKGENDSNGWLIRFSKKGVDESQILLGAKYINDEFRAITPDGSGGFILAGFTSQKIGEEKIPYLLNIDGRGVKKWEKSFTDLKGVIPVSVFINEDRFINCLAQGFSSSGAFEKTVKMVLNSTGDMVLVNSNNNNLRLLRNTYFINRNQETVFVSSAGSSEGNAVDKFLACLDNNFNTKWLYPVNTADVILNNAIEVGEGQLMCSGLIKTDSYKSDCKVISYTDNSTNEITRFMTTKMISASGMNENEKLADFRNRIGRSKFDELYNKYFGEAVNELKLIPGNYSASSRSDIQEKVSIISSAKPVATGDVALKGKYYALLIAINEYKDPLINNLDKPISDAQKLFDVLVNQYLFEKTNVTFLKNPTREQIISSFDKLERELTRDDNLLIFYAGHGYWNETTQKGYWLASDASKQNTANWIGNSSISDYIKSIPAKHTLLIADACFSGSIFKTRDAFGNLDKSAQRLYDLVSRKAMTSGTLTVVPDKSVFVEYLLKRLQDNDEQFLSSEQLFFSFKPAVLNNTDNIPQFGVVGNAGDEGGDFIFIKKK